MLHGTMMMIIYIIIHIQYTESRLLYIGNSQTVQHFMNITRANAKTTQHNASIGLVFAQGNSSSSSNNGRKVFRANTSSNIVQPIRGRCVQTAAVGCVRVGVAVIFFLYSFVFACIVVTICFDSRAKESTSLLSLLILSAVVVAAAMHR